MQVEVAELDEGPKVHESMVFCRWVFTVLKVSKDYDVGIDEKRYSDNAGNDGQNGPKLGGLILVAEWDSFKNIGGRVEKVEEDEGRKRRASQPACCRRRRAGNRPWL